MNQENVYFNEEYKVIIAHFQDYVKLEEFKTIATTALELRKSKSYSKQLVVLSNMKVLPPDVQAWIKSTWFPDSIKSGLKYLGFVVPKSVLASMSVKSANKEAEEESPIDIKYFSNEKDALSWIKSN